MRRRTFADGGVPVKRPHLAIRFELRKAWALSRSGLPFDVWCAFIPAAFTFYDWQLS